MRYCPALGILPAREVEGWALGILPAREVEGWALGIGHWAITRYLALPGNADPEALPP